MNPESEEKRHGQSVEEARMEISREFKIKSKIWFSEFVGESVRIESLGQGERHHDGRRSHFDLNMEEAVPGENDHIETGRE